MNATPMNLNPATAVQAPPTAGKQQDASAPEVPFSQVLSGEIARNGGEPQEEAEIVQNDAAQLLTGSFEMDAGLVLPANDVAIQSEPVSPPADAAPALPDVLLGLAIPPDLMKPAPTAIDSAATKPAADPATGLAVALETRAARAPVNPQVETPAGAPADTQQARPTLAAQADANVAPLAASATNPAFSERLAAARQSDPAMAGERIAELMSHPAMRNAAPAPLEAAPVADPAGTRLAPSVGTTAWGQALGDKLVWMAAGTQQTASLTLNPPNLGPLQVVLNISNDQATASFFSAQPEVRQALEAAFPRLREMMNEAGIQLGQATVSADTPRQNDTPERQGQRITPEFMATGQADPVTLQGASASVVQSGRGLIDTFA